MLNYISGKPESKLPAKFPFLVCVCIYLFFFLLFLFFSGGLMFYSPLGSFSTSEAEMMNIVPLIIKRTGRSPRDQGNGGGREGGCAGGNCQGEMLCRSMKNCTGILPPQLTVWEADLISGESIRLELWEITLPKITLVAAVETLCPQGGSIHRDLYSILTNIYT